MSRESDRCWSQWRTVAEDDQLAGLVGAYLTTKAANEEYGVEDKEEWMEYAGDDKR